MTPYAEVDPIIDAWAAGTAKKLFTEWADRPARFAYLPGLRPFECFQISVDQPHGGRIAVLARSIDTDDDSELEERWEGAVENLLTMLEEATDRVRRWANRSSANGS